MPESAAANRRSRAGLKPVSAAVASARAAEQQRERGIVTVSNGTRFRVRGAPPHIIRDVVSRIPEVPVPRVYIKDKDREEENPSDPDYQKALERRVIEISMEMTNAMLLMGTSIDELGEGVIPPESDEWLEPLTTLGVAPDVSDKYARYLSWLKFYCLRSEVDIAYLIRDVTVMSGVTELEVMRAARSFRDSEVRRAD